MGCDQQLQTFRSSLTRFRETSPNSAIRAPCCANALTGARPTPADAPVMTTVSGCFSIQIAVQFVGQYDLGTVASLETDAATHSVHVPAVHRFLPRSY